MKHFFITSFLFLLTFSLSFSQNTNKLKKVICNYCDGKKLVREYVVCPNCKNWNAEYRRKVPCQVCRDTRQTIGPIIKCTRCDGKGYKMELNISERLKEVTNAIYWGNNEEKAYWEKLKFVVVDPNHMYYEDLENGTKYDYFDDGTFYFEPSFTKGNSAGLPSVPLLGKWEKHTGYSFTITMTVSYRNTVYRSYIGLGKPDDFR
jgi:hypothetical protein